MTHEEAKELIPLLAIDELEEPMRSELIAFLNATPPAMAQYQAMRETFELLSEGLDGQAGVDPFQSKPILRIPWLRPLLLAAACVAILASVLSIFRTTSNRMVSSDYMMVELETDAAAPASPAPPTPAEPHPVHRNSREYAASKPPPRPKPNKQPARPRAKAPEHIAVDGRTQSLGDLIYSPAPPPPDIQPAADPAALNWEASLEQAPAAGGAEAVVLYNGVASINVVQPVAEPAPSDGPVDISQVAAVQAIQPAFSTVPDSNANGITANGAFHTQLANPLDALDTIALNTPTPAGPTFWRSLPAITDGGDLGRADTTWDASGTIAAGGSVTAIAGADAQASVPRGGYNGTAALTATSGVINQTEGGQVPPSSHAVAVSPDYISDTNGALNLSGILTASGLVPVETTTENITIDSLDIDGAITVTSNRETVARQPDSTEIRSVEIDDSRGSIRGSLGFDTGGGDSASGFAGGGGISVSKKSAKEYEDYVSLQPTITAAPAPVDVTTVVAPQGLSEAFGRAVSPDLDSDGETDFGNAQGEVPLPAAIELPVSGALFKSGVTQAQGAAGKAADARRFATRQKESSKKESEGHKLLESSDVLASTVQVLSSDGIILEGLQSKREESALSGEKLTANAAVSPGNVTVTLGDELSQTPPVPSKVAGLGLSPASEITAGKKANISLSSPDLAEPVFLMDSGQTVVHFNYSIDSESIPQETVTLSLNAAPMLPATETFAQHDSGTVALDAVGNDFLSDQKQVSDDYAGQWIEAAPEPPAMKSKADKGTIKDKLTSFFGWDDNDEADKYSSGKEKLRRDSRSEADRQGAQSKLPTKAWKNSLFIDGHVEGAKPGAGDLANDSNDDTSRTPQDLAEFAVNEELRQVPTQLAAVVVTPPVAPVPENDAPLPAAPAKPAPPVNPFVLAEKDALSTFALEADTAAYSLSRRYISKGYNPPPAVVRMEEFINAFDYQYPAQAERTFTVHADAAPAPFGKDLTLLKIGVRGKVLGRDGRKRAHLIFVVDASGSMARGDRMPLIQHALGLLVDQLNPDDRVTLVTYGSRSRLMMEAMPAAHRAHIGQALNAIECGNATNMLAGIKSGYELARRHYKAGDVNRIILCSDGVANLGPTDVDAMLALVEDNRSQGITFTSVGVGAGSYDDGMMEQLANRGDGNYVYIDSPAEARRVFVDNFSATLQNIARDVKIQVEFDPAKVRRYRLIGYENRDIADKDFRNDKIDAGEIGSGQSATALYELELHDNTAARSADFGTVFVRYKAVDHDEVTEFARRLAPEILRERTPQTDPRFFLAACVAEFAEILRGSEHAGKRDFNAMKQQLIGVANTLPLDNSVQELLKLVENAQGQPVYGQ
ncbi:MAG: Ca-activated chloride channel family protein [Rhodothermales bacterium]|jgi:Ca-activated chloride channel family protein